MQPLFALVMFGLNLKSYVLLTLPREDCLLQGEVR